MASTEESTSCNREPFLSGDGCDRGNVDIHQFDDLPYCEPIDPTQADIPPEIVDTPINVPIPPTCSCININMKAGIGYGNGFGAGTSFKSVGDCCDGNYESNISLDIPCPVIFRGDKKITASVAYSSSAQSQTKTFARGEMCSVDAFNVDLPLEVTCPINTARAQITVGIGYGHGSKRVTRNYLDNKLGDKCALNALSPELDLNIPCPVIGAKEGKIKVGIGYGDGESVQERVFAKSDTSPAGCSIQALSPELNLSIPCPAKRREDGDDTTEVNIKFKKREDIVEEDKRAALVDIDDEGCGISPAGMVNLVLGCPIAELDKDNKTKVNIEFRKKNDITEESKKAALIDVDEDSCTVKPVPQTDLVIGCPISKLSGKKTLVSVGYNKNAAPKQMDLVDIDDENCTIKPMEAVNLDIPCPGISVVRGEVKTAVAAGEENLTVDEIPGEGCNKTFKINVTFPESGGGGGGGGGICAVTGMTLDISTGAGIRCFLHSKNTETGESCPDTEGTVQGLTSLIKTTVISAVKYEGGKFQKQTQGIYVLSADEPSAWEDVFETTPLSSKM